MVSAYADYGIEPQKFTLRVTVGVPSLLRIKLRAVVDTSIRGLRLVDNIRAQGYPVLGDLTRRWALGG